MCAFFLLLHRSACIKKLNVLLNFIQNTFPDRSWEGKISHQRKTHPHTHTNTYWRRVLGRSVSEIQLKRCPGTSCGEPSAVRQMQKKTHAVSTVFVCVCHRRSRIDWSHTPGPISNCYSVLTIKKVNKLCYKQR